MGNTTPPQIGQSFVARDGKSYSIDAIMTYPPNADLDNGYFIIASKTYPLGVKGMDNARILIRSWNGGWKEVTT